MTIFSHFRLSRQIPHLYSYILRKIFFISHHFRTSTTPLRLRFGDYSSPDDSSLYRKKNYDIKNLATIYFINAAPI